MNDILRRIREIAVTHCNDYPSINTISEYECLFAIEETLKGLSAALNDWAKRDTETCEWVKTEHGSKTQCGKQIAILCFSWTKKEKFCPSCGKRIKESETKDDNVSP